MVSAVDVGGGDVGARRGSEGGAKVVNCAGGEGMLEGGIGGLGAGCSGDKV